MLVYASILINEEAVKPLLLQLVVGKFVMNTSVGFRSKAECHSKQRHEHQLVARLNNM